MLAPGDEYDELCDAEYDSPVEGTLETSEMSEEELLEDKFHFTPPLWTRRIIRVAQYVKEHCIRKIVDFGCGEGKMLSYLRDITSVEELIGVDLNVESLQRASYRLEPRLADFSHKREIPLRINLFRGDICEPDHRVFGPDLLTLIEVIEHLPLTSVKQATETIFTQVRPIHVIVSTPNSDFNVLYGLKSNHFRHTDHKFEWTREEFTGWAREYASRYGYSVQFEGIGEPPPGQEHLGCSTQIALFSRREPPLTMTSKEVTSYSPFWSVVYPVRTRVPLERRVLDEVSYTYRRVCQRDDVEIDEFVPISEIYRYEAVRSLCTMEQLIEILSQSNEFEVDAARTHVRSLWESDSDNYSITSEKG